MIQPKILTRDDFRNQALKRDGHKCVICGNTENLSVHHLLERRLFQDGSQGYFIDNAATLCEPHHIKAEETTLTCEEIREAAGIKTTIIPSHYYPDDRYTKWGDVYIYNGMRMRGELFDDESVQKVLPEEIKKQYTKYIKYPRTWHLPWSEGRGENDRVLDSVEHFKDQEVVVTLKCDGEQSSVYNDYYHARAINSSTDATRHWLKNFITTFQHEIPEGWRVCGENLYAKHSIHYTNLSTFFLCFSIWNEKNMCLSWDDTIEWSKLLNIETVPVLYRGIYDEDKIKSLFQKTYHNDEMEGYVIRKASSFHYRDFKLSLGKFVRRDHITTNEFWARTWVPNKLKDKA